MTDRIRWPVLAELAAFALVWVGVIILLGGGEHNGIGYFQAPGNDLYWPLAIGGAMNFAFFAGVTFHLLPRWQESGSLAWLLAGAAAVIAGNVIVQTIAQLGIIAWREPGLADVGLLRLARENLHIAIVLPVWCLLYRSVRDWLTRRRTAAPVPAPSESRIAFGSDANPVMIHPAEIRAIGAQGNYAEIDLGTTSRRVHGSLARMAAKLPADRFVRIHRSWIVNLDHVERMTRTSARVGARDVPVGERFADRALKSWRARTGR